MNGVEAREVRGSIDHEHNLAGKSMSSILQPEPIGSQIPKASNTFASSGQEVGISARISRYESKDPATLLKPSANFRKASEAS